ncbi:MAG: ScyD/ScyE family protein [Acidobacteriota bacterium]|nr:ScyD/ScyE family protein [Acidobacteriota bacterium]
MTRTNLFRFTLPIVLLSLLGVAAVAQTRSVLTGGLKGPGKILYTDGGGLIVAEGGQGPNTGRVSLVDRCGNRTTLVDGLPAGVSSEGGTSGPSGLAMRGRTLFVSIGEGDALVAGDAPGTAKPNPNGPASPLLSSILAIEFNTEVDRSAGGFAIASTDHATIKGGAGFNLRNAQNESAAIKVLADFPDFVPAPFIGSRASNPFALAIDGNQLYVADAGGNLIRKVNIDTGTAEVLTGFAPLPNPLPFGPPVVDVVPDGIRVFGDKLLVTFLTGFPFANGRAEVRSVELATGKQATFIGGLTTAIDVLPVKTRLGADQFYVLEISANLAQGAPGRLLRFDSQTAAPIVIAGGLIGAVGIARDARSGDVFISETFTGRILQITGSEYDVCLQDDNTGDVLRFNSLTGEYLFVSCKTGVVVTGRGKVSREGCATELNDSRVAAVIDRCLIAPQNRGAATIRRTPFGTAIFINDSNTTDNTCTGR